jgi:ribosomal protein S18 acetylase RimI-like enzyme
MPETIPLSQRPGEGWQLCREALAEIAGGRFAEEEWIVRMRQALDSGESVGVLAVEGPEPIGIATWSRIPLPARRISLLYLRSGWRTPATYREFLRQVIDGSPADGPVAFSTGDLLGLDAAQQAEMMEPLGFRRFSRTEMGFPDGAPLPSDSLRDGIRARRVRLEDAAELSALHRVAYSGRFDRYLFMEDPDPGRDSERGMEKLLGGEWGLFLPEDSYVAVREGRIVGATLLVTMEGYPLLADVMVDPAERGQGIAGALIAASLASVRGRAAPALRLNVTDGNARAERLYRSLGFTPLFTGVAWYATGSISVSPEQD